MCAWPTMVGWICLSIAGAAEAHAGQKCEETMRSSMSLTRMLLAALAAIGFAQAAAAEDVAQFYSGRTVSLVVGHEVGTGFDIYARVLARHLDRHIPGNPAVVVQNMPGASGVTAANWLYRVAPKDGTAMATFVHTVPFDPLFGNKAAQFEPDRFTWIGNMEESVGTCGVSRASGIVKFDDLLTREALFGATGATGPLSKFALALKNLLGAKIKLVQGYKGSASVKLAMQRDEVQGVCGLPVSTLTSFWRDDWESGAFKPIIQLSGDKHPALRDVPHVDEYAKSDDERQVFALIFGAQILGRPFAAPPEVPRERSAAVRAAFMATMRDPAFLADAAKTQIEISPANGEAVAALIARLTRVPPAVVARANQAFRRD
jgi:tripartite-type tricarboxylate transporter receptor subunit TctC